ncbi:hypothetical protein V5O48_004929 [Marasmius crinis-equi]|uniref:Post-SET domain-containing protein n=1 Tax=Marasmius crinis-equi TaxID=585013 RepID=A0ABR3FNN6_9AGAR
MKPGYNSSYPNLMEVRLVAGNYMSSLHAKKSFFKGEVIADLALSRPAAQKTRFTVQVEADEHIELNSDLVYMNHSCDPNVAFDILQQRVVALQDIDVGSELTFFYPSTEWDAEEPFECRCGSKNCLKLFSGAKSIATEVLGKQLYISPHIWKLVKKRDELERM